MMPAPKFPQYNSLIFETWPIERCIGYARNPRKNDHAVDRVASAIREFGFRVPIVAKSDGTVVDGHLRLKAAAKLGLTEVPVILADDLTDAQIKAFRLSVNKVSEFAEWDVELLKLEFADLDAAGFDLTLTGFDLGEIAALTLDTTEGLTDPDAVPDAPAVPVTVMGDVWLLGRHRLMCGDSTSIDAVERLMDGQKPNTMVTDPPYGVELDQSWRDKALGGKALGKGNAHLVDNDDRADWTDVWALFEGNVAYVWHASSFTDVVMNSLRNAGLEPSQQIIWNKSVMVMGRSDYHFKHEPCWYAIRKGQNHNWKGDRKQTTIWDAAPPNHIMGGSKEEKTSHPTQKPAALYEKAYLNHTNPGEYVYEPFGGSGTSVVVCEKIGRQSLTMELDPKYCDVIIQRWQNFTGQTATLEATGQPFAPCQP